MKMNKPDNIEKYQGNYSESGFWNKVKKVALKAGAKVIYVALILYYELADPNVSLRRRQSSSELWAISFSRSTLFRMQSRSWAFLMTLPLSWPPTVM